MKIPKAYRLRVDGGPECIQLDDVPAPAQDFVAVNAVHSNPLDWKVREGS